MNQDRYLAHLLSILDRPTQLLGRKAKSFDLPLSGLRGPVSATPQFLQHRSPCFRVHSPDSLRTLPDALLLQTLQGGAHLGGDLA